MENTIRINHDAAFKAMTAWLIGKPGEMIPLCTSDPKILDLHHPDQVMRIEYRGKKLTLYIGCIVSNIETKDIWLITYLQKVG